MSIVWSDEALEDLKAVNSYISAENPEAAGRMVRRIISAAEDLLSRRPDLGRPGRVPGTRELVISGTPYIVPYRAVDGQVQVIRVYHSARKWPESF